MSTVQDPESIPGCVRAQIHKLTVESGHVRPWLLGQGVGWCTQSWEEWKEEVLLFFANLRQKGVAASNLQLVADTMCTLLIEAKGCVPIDAGKDLVAGKVGSHIRETLARVERCLRYTYYMKVLDSKGERHVHQGLHITLEDGETVIIGKKRYKLVNPSKY